MIGNLNNDFKIVRLASPGEVAYSSSNEKNMDFKNAHKNYIMETIKEGNSMAYGGLDIKNRAVRIMVRESLYLADGRYYAVFHAGNNELISSIIYYFKDCDLEPVTIDEYLEKLKHPKIIKFKPK